MSVAGGKQFVATLRGGLPWFVPTLVAIGYVLVRDAPRLSLAALLMLGGALSAAMLVVVIVDGLVRLVRVGDRAVGPLRWGAITIATACGLGFGVLGFWESRSLLPTWTPALLLAVAGLAILGFVRVRRPAAYDRRRWALGTAVSATLLAALFIHVHRATGTLFVVRPGTGMLHVGLFAATWIASVALVLPVATRYCTAEKGSSPSLAYRAFGFAAVVAGVAFLEVDRRMFVDLYEDVHVWLGVIGLLSLDSGLRLLLSGLPQRPMSRADAVAGAVLVVAAAYFVLRSARMDDISLRSELKPTAAGSSLLRFFPASRGPTGSSADRHPALNYDQYLEEKPPLRRPNMLLVTVDALRYDVIGELDRPNARVPNLHAFARKAVRFRNAYSAGPRTAMGLGTLMLGRYSANVDWELWFWRGGKMISPKGLPKEKLAAYRGKSIYTTIPTFHPGATLAERIRKARYATAAAAYTPGEFFRPGLGFDKGFDRFADLTKVEWKGPTSDRILDRALHELDSIPGEPWFLWIHFYDPHVNKRSKKKYEVQLKHLDDAFGKLIQQLKKRGYLDRTVIGVTSDHGEAFGEHRHSGHGTSVYDEQVRVPLLLRIPGVAAREERHAVATIDLAATFVVVAGGPTHDLDGVNLLPLVYDRRYPKGRPVFTEGHRYTSKKGKRTLDVKAVVVDNHKLIIDRLRGTAELYDLAADPKESRNIRAERPDVFERMHAILTSFLQLAEKTHPQP